MLEEFINKLNTPQKEAVLSTEGYVRVIAGAGSGKTHALTMRYAYLVEELGVSPGNILCITFTNKSAREMKLRLRRFLGDEIDTSFVSTLHSFCTRVLRKDIGKLFYPENFVVLDTIDQKNILEEIYEELGIKMDTATFEYMIDQIRYEKNLGTYMDYVAKPSQEFIKINDDDLKLKIIYRYIEKQKKYFGLDFFDLINFTIYLFKNHEDILQKWQNQLHYVMVDEFQDITMKEFKLIRTLTDLHQNFFVVGDPDQNIYEWRGSKMEVLLDFEKNIKDYFDKIAPSYFNNHPIGILKNSFKTIFLNQNYRSTKEIITASNDLINKNKNRIEKKLYTENEDGEKVVHFHGKNDDEEILFIVNKIKEHITNNGKYCQIAILYRSSYVSRFIEKGLLKYNIPYVVYGGVGFYERKEIKDVLSYLRLIEYNDDLSFKRIVNVPRRKMGKNKIAFLQTHAENEKITLYQTLKKHIDNPIFIGSKAKEFVTMIEKMKNELINDKVSEILQKLLIEGGYEQYIRESGEMDRLDNLSELLRSIVALETNYGEPLPLPNFLQEVSLESPLEEIDNNDCIKIMTTHIAKGLEFHTVFIAGLNEKIFPSPRALEERKKAALEEERRLCYVAMTRAKKNLYMSESEGFGFRGYMKTPSRFLFDVEEKNLIRIGNINNELMEEYKIQSHISFSSSNSILAIGTRVKHKVFGEGIIEEVDVNAKTYFIRFLNGIKPIRFDYQGLSQIL